MINGLILIEDFISRGEENFLVNQLPAEEKQESREKKRNNIKRYGVSVYPGDYSEKKIPDCMHFLVERLKELGYTAKHLTINEYYPGNGVNFHIDHKQSGPIINIVSLLSDATMQFRKGDIIEELVIPRRSLVQLTGEARTDWEHGIENIDNYRISLVFRHG